MAGDALAHVHHDGPDVVDPVDVVGMRMRDHDAVDPRDLGAEKLLAQVRRGVDEHHRLGPVGERPFEQNGAPAAPVARFVRVAGAPSHRDTRHATRRAAAQDRERESHAAGSDARGGSFENRRATLALVAAASVARSHPFTSASTLAVCTT